MRWAGVLAAIAWGSAALCEQGDDPVALAEEAIQLAQLATAKPAESDERFELLKPAAARALDARGALGLRPQPTEQERAAVDRAIGYVALAAPQALELQGVPHFFQSNDLLCALASTRMVLHAAGVQLSEADLLRIGGEMLNPQGLHVSFFSAVLQSLGLEAITGEGTAQLLRCALVAGRPVAVFQRVTPERNTQHMRVVIGYDRQEKAWITLDPAPQLGPRLVLSEELFDELWNLPWREDGATRWFGLVWRIKQKQA